MSCLNVPVRRPKFLSLNCLARCRSRNLAALVGKADYAYRTLEGVYVVPFTKLGA